MPVPVPASTFTVAVPLSLPHVAGVAVCSVKIGGVGLLTQADALAVQALLSVTVTEKQDKPVLVVGIVMVLPFVPSLHTKFVMLEELGKGTQVIVPAAIQVGFVL